MGLGVIVELHFFRIKKKLAGQYQAFILIFLSKKDPAQI